MNTKTINIDNLLNNAYMINVKSDVDRLELEKILFTYHNLKFPNIFEAYTTKDDCRTIASNSHKNVILLAKSKKLQYIMIFEDDVYPCNNIREKLSYYLTDIPDNIDYLLLSWSTI